MIPFFSLEMQLRRRFYQLKGKKIESNFGTIAKSKQGRGGHKEHCMATRKNCDEEMIYLVRNKQKGEQYGKAVIKNYKRRSQAILNKRNAKYLKKTFRET